MSDNRKYYYLKLKENYFDDDSIVLLESMQDGVLYSNILLKLYLKSLKHGGRLQLDEDIPYTAQMIATITRQQIGTVERALQIFLKLGLVEVLDSGTFYIHVRCLIDECANIGQIPQLEKLVATIRSREISACLVLQTRSQLKAIYKDNADTIVGNMDSQIFLGGSEPTTLKELSEALGKETIDSYNNSDTRGNSPSYGTNYQKLGHELLSRDEIAVLDGDKCILQLRGVRPFLSDKYDLTQHPNYKYTSDYDPKNALDIEKFLNRKEKIHPDDTFIMVDADSLPSA